jgi:hypothetical protein
VLSWAIHDGQLKDETLKEENVSSLFKTTKID